MIKMIKNLNELESEITQSLGVLVYFSNDVCNVGKALMPKIELLVNEKFPRLNMVQVNTKETPDISAQHMIFTVPCIVVYMGGKEFLRESRNISVEALSSKLEEVYKQLIGLL